MKSSDDPFPMDPQPGTSKSSATIIDMEALQPGTSSSSLSGIRMETMEEVPGPSWRSSTSTTRSDVEMQSGSSSSTVSSPRLSSPLDMPPVRSSPQMLSPLHPLQGPFLLPYQMPSQPSTPLGHLQPFPAPFAYPPPLPREEAETMRQQYIPKSCTQHYNKDPLKLVRGSGQYVYTDDGVEYYDCANAVAHVGHCNAHVINAGKVAMMNVGSGISSSMTTATTTKYFNKLRTVFPHELDTFLVVTSGSEANDLALQLARLCSNGHDVVTVEGSYHGFLSEINCMSQKEFSLTHSASDALPVDPSATPRKMPDWVHVVPCPDLYQGKFNESVPDAAERYCQEAREIINEAVKSGRKIACFICEPIMTHAGVIIPPEGWLASIYNDIRAVGGLVIADEIGCGLGRTGAEWWSFQLNGVVPDIVTIGKPIGNGHPMAIVVTRASIAAKLGVEQMKYECNEVEAAIGLAVLDTIRSENMMKNARDAGTFLREGLKSLAANHPNIGHVRGVGFIIGVEIVNSREKRKPSKDIADKIFYKLKEHHIIVGLDGRHKNVIILSPPMCFDMTNAHQVMVTMNKVLQEIEKEMPDDNPYCGFDDHAGLGRPRLISLGVFDELQRFNMEDYLDNNEAVKQLLALD